MPGCLFGGTPIAPVLLSWAGLAGCQAIGPSGVIQVGPPKCWMEICQSLRLGHRPAGTSRSPRVGRRFGHVWVPGAQAGIGRSERRDAPREIWVAAMVPCGGLLACGNFSAHNPRDAVAAGEPEGALVGVNDFRVDGETDLEGAAEPDPVPAAGAAGAQADGYLLLMSSGSAVPATWHTSPGAQTPAVTAQAGKRWPVPRPRTHQPAGWTCA